MRTTVSPNPLPAIALAVLACICLLFLMTGCGRQEETFTVRLRALPGSPDPSDLDDPKSMVGKLVLGLTGQQPEIEQLGDNLYRFTVVGRLKPCATARLQTPITRLEIVGSEYHVPDNRPVPDDAELIVTEADLKSVYLEYNRLDRPEFVFEFTSEGRRKFEEYTTDNVGKYVMFAFGGRIVNWVPVEGPVTGSQGIVEGQFGKQQAFRYLLGLRMAMAGYRLEVANEPWKKGPKEDE